MRRLLTLVVLGFATLARAGEFDEPKWSDNGRFLFFHDEKGYDQVGNVIDLWTGAQEQLATWSDGPCDQASETSEEIRKCEAENKSSQAAAKKALAAKKFGGWTQMNASADAASGAGKLEESVVQPVGWATEFAVTVAAGAEK